MKFTKCTHTNRQKACNSFQQDYNHGTPHCIHDDNEFSICMAKIQFESFEPKSLDEDLRKGKKHIGWLCGCCNAIIEKYDIFCKHCGNKVNWTFDKLTQRCIHIYDPCEGKCTGICRMYFPVNGDMVYPKRKI